MLFNRNDKCWCGSGLKYKKCHMEFDQKIEKFREEGYEVPTRNLIKTKEQIEGIRASAKINNGVLDLIESKIKVGMTTEEINTLAHEYTVSHGAVPACLNYEGFPKSICTSINDEICHGIPDKNVVLKEGDIINCDATTILNGYVSDASRMFIVGEASEKAKRLVEVTRECLRLGVEAAKPWGFLGDIGEAIQTYAEKNGYSVVTDFGGHGVGLSMHEEPFVPHYGKKGTGMLLVPGMVITIEPMINEGSDKLFVDADNGWTALTEDGGLSAQWEHTLLITEDGVEIIAR